jgi:hypothetical protein
VVGASSGHIVARKGAVWGLTAAIRLENGSSMIRGRAEGEIPEARADRAGPAIRAVRTRHGRSFGTHTHARAAEDQGGEGNGR